MGGGSLVAVRIGLLTDTHLPSDIRHLWDEVRTAFDGVDLILHGGDIVTPGVLDWLEDIAPTLAARGNNDGGWEDQRMQDLHLLDVEGWRLAMIHDMEPEDRPIEYLRDFYLKGEAADIIVTGHTHFERLDYRDGVLHPHAILSTANRAFTRRYRLPAWIHVGSTVRFRRMLSVGDEVEVRTVGSRKWRRKGHEFLSLDIAYLVAGQLATTIQHVSIFRIATRQTP